MKKAILAVLLLFGVSIAQAQPPQQEFTDPVALLKAVAKTYADGPDTFHLEAIIERTQAGEFRRDWSKTYRTAIKGPDNLYRIETRSFFGSYLQVSDGRNEWLYLSELKSYVKRPVPQNWPTFPKMMTAGISEIRQAWDMRTFLDATAGEYKHANMLPAETIEVEGHTYPCYVVHVTSEDSTTRTDKGYRSDSTFWIDRNALVFRKEVEHADGHIMLAKNLVLPSHFDTTTIYPVVDFHPQTSRELFQFTPPADAKEVASLDPDFGPVPDHSHPKAQMVGQAVPDISLSADGNKIALSSFRGKPLLIDLWATWCGPCLISLPTFNHIYADLKAKEISVISFDQDRDPDSARSYLARHHYEWTNYHDPERSVEKAFKGEGIPLTVLIDAQGKIVYYDFGGDEAALRKAIASLGPEFASIAPREASTSAAAPADASKHN